MLEELCKPIEHCCATLRRSRKKRNFRSCWLKSLTGFKLRSTTPNITQPHATTCNRVCRRTQHVTSNNVASVCTGIDMLSQLKQLISSINSTFVEGDGFIYYLLVLLLYVKNQINSRGYNESACIGYPLVLDSLLSWIRK